MTAATYTPIDDLAYARHLGARGHDVFGAGSVVCESPNASVVGAADGPDDIIALDSFGLIDAWAELSPSDEFLYFKHLFALQETLRVYAGHSHGHQGAKVALAKVSHSTQGIYLSGLVDIQGITEDIRACGNCRSCRDTLPSREQTV